MLDLVLQDLRFAFRRMRSAPGFTFAVVATLALTIGANTALFSLFSALVLRTMPVRNPEQLVLLQATDDRQQQNRPIFYAMFAALAELPVFETLVLYSGGGLFQIEARSARNEGLIEASTPGLFETLGLQPYLGRFFTTEDAPADGPAAPVAVLSYDFWRKAFGGDPSAIGESILISGTPATVIGVTPPGFKGFYVEAGFGFSVPLSFLNRQMTSDLKRPVRGLNAVGRLAPDVSLDQARAAVEAIWPTIRVDAAPPSLSPTERSAIATQRIRVESLATGFSYLRRQYQDPLRLFAGITGLLLVLGCVNLSGLLLARTTERLGQVGICFALGASTSRVVRPLLLESLLLSAIGTMVSLPLASWTATAVGTLLWQDFAWQGTAPLAISLTPDSRVVLLTAMLTITTGLVIGILPAWSATRSRALVGLRSDRTVVHSATRWGEALLVVQIAITLVLLVGAGLLLTSLLNLRSLDTGLERHGIRFSRLFAVPDGYRDQDDAIYYPELVRRLSEVAGVQSVALATNFPTAFALNASRISTQAIAQAMPSDTTDTVDAIMESITPGFFHTIGVAALRGRDFTWLDDARHPAVAIINESLSHRLFPESDAIGRTIRVGKDPTRTSVEVVGVASDAAMGSYRLPHMPVVFRPRMQELTLARAPVLLFRTKGDTAVIDRAMESVILSLGHEYPRRFRSMDEHMDLALFQERLLASVSAFFAGLAVLLAFVGLYGALSQAVARRTREIGVRMALGASRLSVVLMIARQGFLVALLGVVIGIPCAIAAGGILRSFLFDLDPAHPFIFMIVSASFLVVSSLAGIRPVLRASTVDPITVLRAE